MVRFLSKQGRSAEPAPPALQSDANCSLSNLFSTFFVLKIGKGFSKAVTLNDELICVEREKLCQVSLDYPC